MGLFNTKATFNPFSSKKSFATHALGAGTGGGYAYNSFGSPKDAAKSGAKKGGILGYLSDPMDLFGEKAKYNQNTIAGIQEASAAEGLAQQRAMLEYTNALLDPYRKASEENIPYLEGLAGGASGEMSPQAMREWEQGARQVNASLAARGLLNSGARRRTLADLSANVGQRDIGRQWGRLIDINQLGSGALNALGTAGRGAGNAAENIYGNYGNALNQSYQSLGQARANTGNQAAQSLYGMQDYFSTRGQ